MPHSERKRGKFPGVAILVLNYCHYEATAACIKSLQQSTYPNYKIVLIDNASPDGSGELLHQQFPEIQYIQTESNLGYAGGNNRGIEFALKQDFDLVWLINNDTTVEPSALTELVKVMTDHPETAIAGSAIHYPNHQLIGGRMNKTVLSWEFFSKAPNGSDNPLKCDFVSGCSMLIRSSYIKKHGPLCEDYFLYVEEVDYAIQVMQNGFACYAVPRSKVYHSSSVMTPQKTYYLVRNRIVCTLKQMGITTKILTLSYFLCILLRKTVKYPLGKFTNCDWAFVKALAHGFLRKCGRFDLGF